MANFNFLKTVSTSNSKTSKNLQPMILTLDSIIVKTLRSLFLFSLSHLLFIPSKELGYTEERFEWGTNV